MDPLPNVNKAYCMIARVEIQRQVTGGISGPGEIIVVVNKPQSFSSGNVETTSNALIARTFSGQKNRKDTNKKTRNNKFCDHCQKLGHSQDQCFKIIGYPDWYDTSKDGYKGKKPIRFAANVVSHKIEYSQESPLDEVGISRDHEG